MSDRRDPDVHRMVMEWPDDAVAEIESLRARAEMLLGLLDVRESELVEARSRLAEARADMTRLLRDGIVNAPCPTPAQWRQLQDFAKGYLAGADSASVEGEK